jgi:hypothetical protein
MIQRNMLLKPGALALALSACAGAAHGFHNHGDPDRDIVIADVEQRLEARFASADTNGDGVISAEEFAAAKLHPGHLGPGRHGRGHPWEHQSRSDAEGEQGGPEHEHHVRRQAAREQMADAMFDRLDSNGDGQLSRDEAAPDKVRAARRSLAKERLFAHMDRDGSGTLDRSEVFHHVERLKRLDSNGDGSVDTDERAAGRQALRDAHRSGPPAARS